MIWQNGYFKTPISANPGNQGNQGSGDGGSYKIVKQIDTEVTIAPNTLNVWDEIETLTINLQAPTEGIVNEYLIQFTSGSTPTVVTLPEDIKWANPLKIKANKIYQISVINNLAAYAEFNALNVPQITLNLTEYDIQADGDRLQIVNPDMISQLQPLCSWIADNEHTGEDIDNKMSELGEPLPPEMLNTVSGVVYEEGFLIINFPTENDIPEVVYGFGIRESLLNSGAPESMYGLVPNDLMNNPIFAYLDLDTGNLILAIM